VQRASFAPREEEDGQRNECARADRAAGAIGKESSVESCYGRETPSATQDTGGFG